MTATLSDVPRRKRMPTLTELPEWVQDLRGFDLFTAEGAKTPTKFRSGTWKLHLTMPVDPADVEERIDPLLLLMGLAFGAEDLDTKMTDVVRFCRTRGKSWTQIGEMLGISKQAAWERFSGEE